MGELQGAIGLAENPGFNIFMTHTSSQQQWAHKDDPRSNKSGAKRGIFSDKELLPVTDDS
jgi:hypothetical protein